MICRYMLACVYFVRMVHGFVPRGGGIFGLWGRCVHSITKKSVDHYRQREMLASSDSA